MSIKTPDGRVYKTYEDLIRDGWVQRKGGRLAQLVVQWQVWIWLVGLVFLMWYTVNEVNHSVKPYAEALQRFQDGNFLLRAELAKKYGVEYVSIDNYMQLANAYNLLLRRCCLLEGNPKEVCNRIPVAGEEVLSQQPQTFDIKTPNTFIRVGG